MKGSEPSLYRVQFDLPDITHLTCDEQHAVFKELSIQAGLNLSYTALTWHEVLTWYGYSATVVLSEKASAFSYEDMYTHALGVAIADRALRDETRRYNAAVTYALKDEITQLEPLEGRGTQDALNRVHKKWWRYQTTLKRLTDIGESGAVAPLLVPGIETSGAKCYPAPVIGDVKGFDMSSCMMVRIEPQHRVGRRIAQIVGRENGFIQPSFDFGMIMNDIRRGVAEIEREMPVEMAASASDS